LNAKEGNARAPGRKEEGMANEIFFFGFFALSQELLFP
jgi:hypothetical protein